MYIKSITYHLLLCAAIYTLNEYIAVHANKLKVCIVESNYRAKIINNTCPNLSTTPFQCVIAKDRFECLRRLTTGDADMTVLKADDLVAASMYNEYDLLVTHELRLFYTEKQQFEMVALVKQDIKSLQDLKRKRFCHPGFETTDTYTKALSMYFENWIIPKECNPTKTLLENRVARLSQYFEEACIAGPWVADAVLDTKLKSKYKNLCALCDHPASCYTGDKYHGREGAILCLTDNVGDIAWVRLDDALAYFKSTEDEKEYYSYLCPDGMTRPVKMNNPCVWLRQPWPVVVVRSNVAERALQIIDTKVNSSTPWKSLLQNLLMAYHITLVKTETLYKPGDYLRQYPGFLSANNRATCRPSRRVRWCVSSNLEDQKCRWLREASFVYGLEPTISCILKSDRASCFEEIKNQEADIFVSRPEENLQASKKGLKPILHVTSNKKNDLNRLVAIVKRSSTYKSLKDLKGAKACFTGYESIGWNSFVTIMRNISQGNWDCSDINAVGNFFDDSCVPGLPIKTRNVPRNLYSLCNKDMNAADDITTMSCLKSGRADVVFVNLKNLQKEINLSNGKLSNVTKEQYRILCIDESEKEETCSLSWSTLATIVAHKNITDLRLQEIYTMLLSMEQLFGKNFPGFTPIFSMYGTYDGNQNVIFPDESQHIQLEVNQKLGIRNYDDIIEDIVKQPACSSARDWNLSFYKINLLGSLILTVVFILN